MGYSTRFEKPGSVGGEIRYNSPAIGQRLTLSTALNARLIGTVLLLCAIGVYVYAQSHLRFAFWDDEGHLLTDLTRAVSGKPLYDEVYTIYGPAHLLPRMTFFRLLGTAPTHDWMRFFTFVSWLASVVLGALAVYLHTRSYLLAIVSLALLTVFLNPLGLGSAHPQETEMILLALAAICCARLTPGRVLAPALLAAIAAALMLTKVNLGIFAVAGLALGLGMLAQSETLWRWLFLPAAMLGVAMPFLLLRTHLSTPWVLNYFLVISLAIAAFVCLAWRARDRAVRAGALVPTRALLAASGAFLGVTAGIIGMTCWSGSSLGSTLYMLFVWPLRFPGMVILPGALPSILSFAGPGLAALTLAIAVWRRREARQSLMLDCVCLCLGVAACAVVIAGGPIHAMSLIPPVAPLLLLGASPAPGRPGSQLSRSVLAGLSVFLLLQVYPVPASAQRTWATYLPLIAAIIVAHDGWSGLADARDRLRLPVAMGNLVFRYGPAAAAAVTIAFAVWKAHPLDTAAGWRQSPGLGLPGARNIRLAIDQNARLNWAVANISARCDSFLGRPAVNSINLWSARVSDTKYYAGAWPLVHDQTEQADMLRAVSSGQRTCALDFPILTQMRSENAPASLLHTWIDSLPPVAAVDQFVLRSRQPWPSDFLIHQAREFDGFRDAVGVPGLLLQGVPEWTLHLRFRGSDAGPLLGGQAERQFVPRPASAGAFLRLTRDGRMAVEFPEMQSRLESPTGLTDGRWHEAAFSVSPLGVRMEIDGVERGRWSGRFKPLSAAYYQLGAAWREGTWERFRGEMADVTLSRRAGPASALAVRQ